MSHLWGGGWGARAESGEFQLRCARPSRCWASHPLPPPAPSSLPFLLDLRSRDSEHLSTISQGTAFFPDFKTEKEPSQSTTGHKEHLAPMINIHLGLSPFATPRGPRAAQLRALDSNPSSGPLHPGAHGCFREPAVLSESAQEHRSPARSTTLLGRDSGGPHGCLALPSHQSPGWAHEGPLGALP